MTLAELKAEVDAMIQRCEYADMDASQMVVKVFGEHGTPCRIVAEWIDGDVSTTINKHVAK